MSRPLADLAVAGLDVRLPPSGPASMRLINAATIAGTWTAWVQPMGVGVAAPDDALLAFSVAVDGDDVVLSLADTAAGNPPGLLRDVSGRLVVALGGVPVIAGRCTRTFRARQSTGQVEVVVGGSTVTVDIGGVTIIGSPGGGVSSWDDLTDKPTVFPPDVHTHEPGEVGADPRGMAVAAAAPTGVTVVSYHHFGRSPDGPVHGIPTNGSGTHDPTAFIDGRTYAGAYVEPFMEVAHMVDGVLRHSGTRFLAAGAIALPAASSHAVTLGYVDPIAGPGGGFPDIGMPETGYASTRVGFVDASMSGYFALLEQSDDTANHAFVINIELSGSPSAIAGPWDLGRRLTERDVWTFRHDGSQYVILLNGDLIGSVYDDTADPAEFAMVAAVLGTGSLWLPGVPWISTSLVGANVDAHATTYTPSFPTNWGDTPSTVGVALDILAGTAAKLDDDGLIPDALIPASIARDSEVSSAISSATSGLVSSTDPRLSDARTPLGHTHGLDVLQTNDLDTTKVVAPDGLGGFKLSASPSSGGVWQVISEQTLTAETAAVSFTDLDDWTEIEIRWHGRGTGASGQSASLLLNINGDTGPNYNRTRLYRWTNTVAESGSAESAGWAGVVAAQQTGLNRWSKGRISVDLDQPVDVRNQILAEFAYTSSTVETPGVGMCATEWLNTIAQIASVTLTPSAGNWAVGSRFTVLGRE